MTHTTVRARALQASWWLAEGELALARAWAGTVHAGPQWAHTFGETSPIATLIQLQLAEGDAADALVLAQAQIAAGTSLKRWAELVPLHVWEAAAHLGLDDEPAALDALRAALAIAMPGRFVRAFSPPGTDLHPFLAAARAQLPSDESAYLDTLLPDEGRRVGESEGRRESRREEENALLAFGVPSGPPRLLASPSSPPSLRPSVPPSLRSPLSRREAEVLSLLQAGRSNQQIAGTLFLTERTVKMHVGNLMAKLGVRNRTAAVTRAHQLGLLD